MRVAMMILTALALSFSAAQAREPDKRGFYKTDSYLTRAGLQHLFHRHYLELSNGATVHFGADGEYSYRGPDRVWPVRGRYSFGDGGQVCVTHRNGRIKCDTIVRSDHKLVLVAPDGTRFVIKARYAD